MKTLTDEKLTIVGAAGMIGSNMAQTAIMMGLTSNICLYDPYAPGLEGVAEELFHCGFEGVNITFTSDIKEALTGAKYIVNSGGAARKAGMTREDLLKGNAAIAEEFGKTSKAKVTIGVSGTGGGFKKFCNGETVITGASRPIKPSEVEMCGKASREYIELPVAYDGIAIVVHPKNTWVDHMTVAELKALWAPEAQDKVKTWSQIREGWPDKPIRLFGPGVDSGTATKEPE